MSKTLLTGMSTKQKEQQKKYRKEYRQRPEVKERLKEYNKEYLKEYRQIPEVKERAKEYLKEYYQEHKQITEVKEKRKEYWRKYRQTPPTQNDCIQKPQNTLPKTGASLHIRAWKQFGKEKCEKCGMTNDAHIERYKRRLEMHCVNGSKFHNVMEKNNWKILCKICHAQE
jgi:citrate synthase